jgi:hypothetical protein
MKGKWISRLAQVNKELLLIFSIVASAALVNFFIEGQRLVLTFYNLPTLFAVYYFGRRRAVQAAVATILFVTWVNVMHPTLFNHGPVPVEDLLGWSDLAIWAGFLVIFAYATGTLHEHSEQRMRELRETYYGVLQILSQMISNDKFTQNHSYRVSIYATQIALELGMREDQVEDVRAAALLHDVGKLEELCYERAIGYTTPGQLLGHIVMELETVTRAIDKIEGFPPALKTVLQHVLISHHGQYEFGSPKLPMIREAMVFHYLDDLDSKLAAVRVALATPSGDDEWSAYSNALGRKFLKLDEFLKSPDPATAGTPVAGEQSAATAPGQQRMPWQVLTDKE